MRHGKQDQKFPSQARPLNFTYADGSRIWRGSRKKVSTWCSAIFKILFPHHLENLQRCNTTWRHGWLVTGHVTWPSRLLWLSFNFSRLNQWWVFLFSTSATWMGFLLGGCLYKICVESWNHPVLEPGPDGLIGWTGKMLKVLEYSRNTVMNQASPTMLSNPDARLSVSRGHLVTLHRTFLRMNSRTCHPLPQFVFIPVAEFGLSAP